MGLIARYCLDGDLRDSVGEAHGVALGSTDWVAGKLGKCLNLNNSGTINIPINGVSRHLFSISFWARPTGTPTSNYRKVFRLTDKDGTIFHRLDTREISSSRFFHYTQDIEQGSYSTNSFHTANTFSQQEWQHFVCVFESTTNFSSYTDGIYMGGGNLAPNLDFYADELGEIVINEDTGHVVHLQDLRIYDHPLSRKEILDLSKGLVFHYPLSTDAVEVFGEDSASSDITFEQNAILLNGVSSFVRPHKLVELENGPRTYSLWFNKKTTGSTFNCVLHRADDSSAVGHSDIWIGVSSNGKITATIGANSGAGWAAGETNVEGEWNKWFFVAVSWDGEIVRVYVNGVEQHSYSLNSLTSLDQQPIRFGASSDGGHYQFGGLIRDVRVYASPLSSNTISKMYKNALSLDNRGNLYASNIVESIPCWQNFGGPKYSLFGSNMSDIDIHASQTSILIKSFEETGAMQSGKDVSAYNEFIDRDNVVWIKKARSYNGNGDMVTGSDSLQGGEYPKSYNVFLYFPTGVTMKNILDAVDGEQLNAPVTMYIDNEYYGKTNIVCKYSSTSIGFANLANQYGQPPENLMNNWGARHVISYLYTSDGQNAVRCQFKCWGGGEDIAHEVIWECLPL